MCEKAWGTKRTYGIFFNINQYDMTEGKKMMPEVELWEIWSGKKTRVSS